MRKDIKLNRVSFRKGVQSEANIVSGERNKKYTLINAASERIFSSAEIQTINQIKEIANKKMALRTKNYTIVDNITEIDDSELSYIGAKRINPYIFERSVSAN